MIFISFSKDINTECSHDEILNDYKTREYKMSTSFRKPFKVYW